VRFGIPVSLGGKNHNSGSDGWRTDGNPLTSKVFSLGVVTIGSTKIAAVAGVNERRRLPKALEMNNPISVVFISFGWETIF
jgi:hypothetical protein